MLNRTIYSLLTPRTLHGISLGLAFRRLFFQAFLDAETSPIRIRSVWPGRSRAISWSSVEVDVSAISSTVEVGREEARALPVHTIGLVKETAYRLNKARASTQRRQLIAIADFFEVITRVAVTGFTVTGSEDDCGMLPYGVKWCTDRW